MDYILKIFVATILIGLAAATALLPIMIYVVTSDVMKEFGYRHGIVRSFLFDPLYQIIVSCKSSGLKNYIFKVTVNALYNLLDLLLSSRLNPEYKTRQHEHGNGGERHDDSGTSIDGRGVTNKPIHLVHITKGR